MRTCITFVLLLSAVSAIELSAYDPEACVDASLPPITRMMDVSYPSAFSTPGFNYSDSDSTYPANTICQWSVFTDPGNELQVSFFNFSIEDTVNCTEEYVEIYDGADDTGFLLDTICGDLGTVPPYIASGTEMFVRFVSDDDASQGIGFVSRAGYPVEVTACDFATRPQVFTAPSGLFSTENYPVNYGNNQICEYLFQAPDGQVVELSNFGFLLDENCNEDWVDIYDGPSQQFGLFGGRFHGDMRPSKMISSTNNVFLRFESDNSGSADGFLGGYRFIPA